MSRHYTQAEAQDLARQNKLLEQSLGRAREETKVAEQARDMALTSRIEELIDERIDRKLDQHVSDYDHGVREHY